MFEPDVILPAQFSTLQRKPLSSEKRLLLALLEDAVHCFQTYVLATKPSERQLFHDAEDWINSTDTEWFFSFENVCEVLGLRASCIRRALQQWKIEQLLLRGQQRYTYQRRIVDTFTIKGIASRYGGVPS
jgi:hypothetical protein